MPLKDTLADAYGALLSKNILQLIILISEWHLMLSQSTCSTTHSLLLLILKTSSASLLFIRMEWKGKTTVKSLDLKQEIQIQIQTAKSDCRKTLRLTPSNVTEMQFRDSSKPLFFKNKFPLKSLPIQLDDHKRRPMQILHTHGHHRVC
jgi:hypothetical protein